jgi:hypothetical protein
LISASGRSTSLSRGGISPDLSFARINSQRAGSAVSESGEL